MFFLFLYQQERIRLIRSNGKALNSNLSDLLNSARFINYGSAHNTTVNISIGSRSAIIVSSNTNYGAGGIWFAQYASGSVTVTKIVGDDTHTQFSSDDKVLKVSSTAVNTIFAAVF